MGWLKHLRVMRNTETCLVFWGSFIDPSAPHSPIHFTVILQQVPRAHHAAHILSNIKNSKVLKIFSLLEELKVSEVEAGREEAHK